MRILSATLWRCLKLLAVPWLVLLGVTALCLLLVPPLPQGVGTGRALGLWLHLPAFCLAAASVTALLEAWPLASRSQDGSEWLRRLPIGPLQGMGSAAAGALLAIAIALCTAGLAFHGVARLAGLEDTQVRARAGFVTQGPPTLSQRRPSVHMVATSKVEIQGLVLRPLGWIGKQGMAPVRIRVFGDGIPLHEDWLDASLSQITIDMTPRTIRELRIERRADSGLNLVFPPGSAHGMSMRTYSDVWNSMLACASYLGPVLLAFTVILLARRRLAFPVAWGAGLAVLLLTSLTELTPNAAAITAYTRGNWLLTWSWCRSSLVGVGIAFALVILALGFELIRRNRR